MRHMIDRDIAKHICASLINDRVLFQILEIGNDSVTFEVSDDGQPLVWIRAKNYAMDPELSNSFPEDYKGYP